MEGLRPDVAAAYQRMHGRIGVKRGVRRLAEHLWPGERVDGMAAGVYGSGAGLFVLTDRRVLLVVEGLLNRATEDFTFDRITSVEWSSGMMYGRIIVFAGGTRAEMIQVDKADGRAIVEAVRARMHATSGAPAQPYGGAHPYGGGQAWQGHPPGAVPPRPVAPPPVAPPPVPTPPVAPPPVPPWESPAPASAPAAPAAPGAAPAVPPAPDLVALLRELAKLRDEGILTEDEFAAQKAKLLG